MAEMTKEEANTFLAEFYSGSHHIPGKVKEYGSGWVLNIWKGSFATYDFDGLTRLVILAHKHLIRVEIGHAGMYLQLRIHKREKTGGMAQRHPDLDGLNQLISAIKYAKP